jgi:hypothetical protein
VITRALEKASAEKTVRSLVEQGRSVTEVFREYGVL